MTQVKACLNFYHPPNIEPPQEPIPRKSVQLLSDRIYGVEGHEGKTNDVVFTGFPDPARLNVIYFGGDLQNFEELMVCDRDLERFKDDFNIEATGKLLMKRFHEVNYPAHIWIIRPERYINHKYVVYNDFLRMTNEGQPNFMASCIPQTRSDVTAIPHLQSLLCNFCRIENERLHDSFGDICNPQLPCVLVGFSKGCVVLTKIFCEIHRDLLCNSISPFVNCIREMYWLDSSHNGEEMIWPHDHSMFDRISRCNLLDRITFHAYATPFQIGRPIKLRSCQEFSRLTEILLRLGLQHTSGYLLRGDEINLQTHFDIIKAFPIKRH